MIADPGRRSSPRWSGYIRLKCQLFAPPTQKNPGNKSSQHSSEAESVVRSHKGTSPGEPTSGSPSSSHWDDSAPGSRQPPPGNKSSPPGSPHSWQHIEAETGKTDPSNDLDIQQSVEPIGNHKCHPRKAKPDRSGLPGHHTSLHNASAGSSQSSEAHCGHRPGKTRMKKSKSDPTGSAGSGHTYST